MKPPPLPDLGAIRERMEDQREQVIGRAEAVLMKIHRELYVRSEGRIGERALGIPCLLLTVTGRSTGAAQTVALAYAVDGDDLVVVASNGGKDTSPDWFENLVANPSVKVQRGREHEARTAEVVGQNDRRYERLWRLVNANTKGRYYRYQTATTRAIPLVVLQPA
jgi:deazaflavin-dependent oxidoreductase (nitroreductase family)